MLGPQPAILALYGLLSQPDLPQAALAVLLGRTGRRSLLVNGVEVSIATYLRHLSRLCREAADYHETELGAEEGAAPPSLEQESFEGLKRKLKLLSFFSHSVAAGGTETALQPAIMDPGIYDGKEKFKLASSLQSCLETAVKGHGEVRAALVDLTKDRSAPECAGLRHQEQVFAASVPKLAAMLAAFQLRHDLRAALGLKGSKSLEDLFSKVRDDWVASQQEPKGSAVLFTKDVALRGRLVLVRGRKVGLDTDDRSPRLENIFAPLAAGAPVQIEFSSTGENSAQLNKLIHDFESKDVKTRENARKGLAGLGFLERLRVSLGGLVPASNFITSTLVRDIGYPYIASTLLQSGLYDPARGGGIWLGASYWGSSWRGALSGGPPQSATAGGAAAFMTLLAQDRLVDPHSSAEMRALIQKHPLPATHPTIKSWFKEGIRQLPDHGSLVLVLSKLGVHDGIDDCAYIERKVAGGSKTLRYVAVGLRAKTKEELKALILAFDKCILANNGLTAAQGGHADEHEVLDEELDWPPQREASAPETEDESEFPAEAPLTDEETGIIGTDDRLHVKDTTAIPFRWICSVSVQRLVRRPSHDEKTGLAPAGSGLLISPRHVLTTAHVLHSVEKSSDGSIAAEYEPLFVQLAPARDGSRKPFGEIEAKSWAVHPKWDPKAPLAQYDYALITLDKDVGNQKFKSLGNKALGFWGSNQGGGGALIDNLPSPLLGRLIGSPIVTAGYPESKSQEMWCASGVFSTGSRGADAALTKEGREQWVASSSVFKITADATKGQSGSPVWLVDNGKRYLIGIIEAAGQTYSEVVAVKGDVVSQIRKWM